MAKPPSPQSAGDRCRSFIRVDDVTDDAGFMKVSSSWLPCDGSGISTATGVAGVSLEPQSIGVPRAAVAQIDDEFQGAVIKAGSRTRAIIDTRACIAKVSALVNAVMGETPSPQSAGDGCRSFIRVDDVANDAGCMTVSSSMLACDGDAISTATGVVGVSLAPQSLGVPRAAQVDMAFQGAVITAGSRARAIIDTSACIAKVSALVDAVVAEPPSPQSAGDGCRSFIRVDDVADDAGFMTVSRSWLPCDGAAISTATGVLGVSLAPQSIGVPRAAVAQIDDAFQGVLITAGSRLGAIIDTTVPFQRSAR